MSAVLIVLLVIVVIIVGIVVWAISAYNRCVRARNLVEQSWNQIDVELNRRYDLIPNLVNTIKGSTNFEKSTLESVVGLRNQAASLAGAHADPSKRAEVEQALSSQLQNLVSVTVEAYPDLKSNASFLQLQNELSEIESRIANARKYYNANVGNYNTLIETFPTSFMAGMAHCVKADYFQVQDPTVRANPTVDFGATPPPSATFGTPTPALPAQPSAPVTGYATPVAPTQAGVAPVPQYAQPVAPPAAPAPAAPIPGYVPAPVESTGPFPTPPAPAGEFAQPDFSRPSGTPDHG